ncbi:MAG: YbdK family carboxylate-amine ligase, partial [Burkholderiales bacterium]
MAFGFLPQMPPAFGQPALFGALLLAGLLGGELVRRLLGLPRITGYVLAGVLLGPQISGLLAAGALGEARVLIDLSLGLIVFELGHRLDVHWLRRNRWLFVAAVAESAFGFGAVLATLLAFGFQPLLAASAAAIGTATSPAVVLLVAHELRAAGQVTERMLVFTAVNCVLAYVALTLLLPFLHLKHAMSWPEAALHPLYILGGSVLVGFVASLALLWLARWVGKREDRQFILLVALVVLAVGAARGLNLSVVVTLITLGMLARNFDYQHVLLPLRLWRAAVLCHFVRADGREPGVHGAAGSGGGGGGVHRRALSRQGSRHSCLRPPVGRARGQRRGADARAAADVGARSGDGAGHCRDVPRIRRRTRRRGAVGGGGARDPRPDRHSVRAEARRRGRPGRRQRVSGGAMHELDFRSSPELTLGVELELQLIQPHDLDLARDAGDLLARLGKVKLPGAVKPEITESMIELNTSIHRDHAALAAELDVMRDAVAREAGMLNLLVCGGGTHPFHSWSARRIFPTERFKHILERYGYLAKQFTVFGQHIHLGCANGDDAVYLVHMLTRYVPHFIALSAASPFYQGEDTQFQSSRLTAINAFPLAGHMPFVEDWAEFIEYFEKMRALGVVESMKDFYWDIRPKPEFGTVEIRICDTPLDVARAAQLAAYAQALAKWLLDERPLPPIRAVYLVNAFNRFEA